MLARTHTPLAPWVCVRADKKPRARIAVIRHFLHAVAPAKVAEDVAAPDPEVLFGFEQAAVTDGRLAR